MYIQSMEKGSSLPLILEISEFSTKFGYAGTNLPDKIIQTVF